MNTRHSVIALGAALVFCAQAAFAGGQPVTYSVTQLSGNPLRINWSGSVLSQEGSQTKVRSHSGARTTTISIAGTNQTNGLFLNSCGTVAGVATQYSPTVRFGAFYSSEQYERAGYGTGNEIPFALDDNGETFVSIPQSNGVPQTFVIDASGKKQRIPLPSGMYLNSVSADGAWATGICSQKGQKDILVAYHWGIVYPLDSASPMNDARTSGITNSGLVYGAVNTHAVTWRPLNPFAVCPYNDQTPWLIGGHSDVRSASPNGKYLVINVVEYPVAPSTGLVPHGGGFSPRYSIYLVTPSGLLNLQASTPDNGWQLQAASDVNDKGEVIGTGIYQGFQAGFLADPLSLI